MPRQKQPPQIVTRLAAEETAEFLELCRSEGKTQTEVAREAIRDKLACRHHGIRTEIRDELAGQVEQLQQVVKALLAQQKKTENRMAALIARNNIDIGIVYQVLWMRSNPADREEMFKEARTNAARRSSRKLKEGDLEVKELMKDALSS